MSAPYRCPACQSASVRPRNLAVFIDGSSNKPGDNVTFHWRVMVFCYSPAYGQNTNVVKLYDNVVAGRREDSKLKQREYYLKGIGAYHVDHLSLLERAGNTVYREFEKALAWFVFCKHLFRY